MPKSQLVVKESSVRYFDSKTICRSCDERIKEPNGIVCDYCHKHYCKPEFF